MKEAQVLRQLKGELAVVLTYLALLFVGSTVMTHFARKDSFAVSPAPVAAYLLLAALTVWSHLKCMLTNPGYVPNTSLSTPLSGLSFNATCSICQCVKPPLAHHCRACNRCVYRMDHHCPWVNNCIGYYSQKHFVLFLVYGDALGVFSCVELIREADDLLVWVTVTLTVVSIAFITWVLGQQAVAIYYNLSGIDRLQQQFTRRVNSTQKPLMQNLEETFGEASLRWLIPTSLRSGPMID